MTQPAGDVIKVPKVEPGEREPEWRLVQVPAGTPGGHGSWVETDHPAVVDCMGSAPECAENGCQLSTTTAALAACHEERDRARADSERVAANWQQLFNDVSAEVVLQRERHVQRHIEAEQQLAALTEERDRLETALRQAVNGWACYAKRKIEHDEIARLHGVIAASLTTRGET